MPRYLARRWWAVLPACLLAGMVAFALHGHTGQPALILTVDHAVLPADGYAQARAHVHASDGRELQNVTWRIENAREITDFAPSASDARLQAGIIPGDITLVAAAPGFKAVRTEVHFSLDPTDQFGDGTPDFLRLQDAEDQTAFRRWFAFLAESTSVQKETDRPPEVNDCAALIRFAYREALRRHDGPWADAWHLPMLPNVASVQKYEYPYTALGAGLFRIRPGSFVPQDAVDGTFAQFADAESLRRYNTHFVSRDLDAARSGDLLFFRQAGREMPFHAMIYLGHSFFDEGTDWLIYHTGPQHTGPSHIGIGKARAGEIRRVTVRDLSQHPQVCWRPLPQNPAFLGVYRWNILREAN